MPPQTGAGLRRQGGYSRWTMSETELSVICKNCGSEVSPYVTECPYCGARLRKRAPKLERRGDAPRGAAPAPPPAALLPPAPAPIAQRRRPALRDARRDPRLGVLLLIQKASGDSLSTFGGLLVPRRRRVVALLHRALRLRRRRLPVRRRGRPGDLRDRGRAPARQRCRPRCCCSPAARWGCWPPAASPTRRATSP